MSTIYSTDHSKGSIVQTDTQMIVIRNTFTVANISPPTVHTPCTVWHFFFKERMRNYRTEKVTKRPAGIRTRTFRLPGECWHENSNHLFNSLFAGKHPRNRHENDNHLFNSGFGEEHHSNSHKNDNHLSKSPYAEFASSKLTWKWQPFFQRSFRSRASSKLTRKWQPFLQQWLRRGAPSKLTRKWQPFVQQWLRRGHLLTWHENDNH